MTDELTHTSQREYDTILYGNMSPQMAASYLRQGKLSVRSFSAVLHALAPGMDLVSRLSAFYCMILPDRKPASLRRTIQNWVRGKSVPSSREDFFRIAFALSLSEGQLNYLLGMCQDYTIQYRCGREAVLAWFLRYGYGYQEAIAFLASLPSEKDTISGDTPNMGRLTQELRSEFLQAHTLAELRICYLRNLERLGQRHLRGYYYFNSYLKQLIHPTSVLGEREPDYSIDHVMELYLSMQMPSGRRRSNYSLVQKLIKYNWPNSTAIKNIRNQVEDVPRKLLLLLYVVTENSVFREDYREIDEEYITLEERVQDHWWTLNGMLSDCSMAPLDLRNPFDWLILYAISAEEEAMSERLEGVIRELYQDVESEPL